MDGIEREDREFIASMKEKREPSASLRQVLPCKFAPKDIKSRHVTIVTKFFYR
jgi:hypothetical protein